MRCVLRATVQLVAGSLFCVLGVGASSQNAVKNLTPDECVAAARALDASRARWPAEEIGRRERDAREICLVALGIDHELTLTLSARLASTYGTLGQFTAATALGEDTLMHLRAKFGADAPVTLRSMNNLAVTYSEIGRYADALALNEEAFARRRDKLGINDRETLRSMNNLANAYRDLGRYSQALALNEDVLKRLNGKVNANRSEIFGSMQNLAVTYSHLGRHADAAVLEETLLKKMRESRDLEGRNVLDAMNNLAATYGALNRDDDALALREAALKVMREKLGNSHPDTLMAMGSLAVSHARFGRLDSALELQEEAFKGLDTKLGMFHPDTVRQMNMLSKRYLEVGRTADAASLGRKFIEIAESLRSTFSDRSFENRQSSFAEFAKNYGRHSRTISQAGGDGAQIEGFHVSELAKARTLLEAAALQRGGRSSTLPAEEAAVLSNLSGRIASLGSRIANTPPTQSEARLSLESDRNELTRQYASSVQRLKQKYPRYALLVDAPIVAANGAVSLLTPDAVFISYLLEDEIDGRITAWLLTDSGVPSLVDLGPSRGLAGLIEILRRSISFANGLDALNEELEESLYVWMTPPSEVDGRITPARFFLQARGTKPPVETALRLSGDEGMLKLQQSVAERLIGPLLKHPALLGKKKWIIAPDGALAQLAFEALPIPDQTATRVIDVVNVHYTQSLSLLAMTKARSHEYQVGTQAGDVRSGELFAMGNPNYLIPAAQCKSRPPTSALQANDAIGHVDALTYLDHSFCELPGTEREVRSVAALFPSDKVQVHTGDAATEERLLSLNKTGELKKYKNLLFSTHAYLSPNEPALSSIVLGLKNRTAGTDGYVTAAEWMGYDLKSDLVVLSACDTGRGKQLSGEGILGLPFALYVAGNTNTLMTLWPIDDRETAAFMKVFFSKMRDGKSAAVALNATKRELAHKPPAYWAPFVLYGVGD